jgi:hypothetical protein
MRQDGAECLRPALKRRTNVDELVFEVTQESDGGYVAECLGEDIFTQGEDWEQLRQNVVEVTAGFLSADLGMCDSCGLKQGGFHFGGGRGSLFLAPAAGAAPPDDPPKQLALAGGAALDGVAEELEGVAGGK